MTEPPEPMPERPNGRQMRKTIRQDRDGDLVHELLRDFRVDSSVLCRSVMAAPWGFGVPGRDVGSFHVVTEGDGWLEVDGSPDPVALHTGDLVVLPHGDAHRVRDAPGSAAPPLSSILEERSVVDGEVRFGGDDGPVTEIVCGTFSSQDAWPPPWAWLLPPAIRSTNDRGSASWRGALTTALSDEARAPTEGGAVVVNRLLEVLIGDALRSALGGSSEEGRTSVRALADRRIGPALARIHERPEAPWTTERLAGAASMSRSSFAHRFRAVVGESPMRYVTRVRLSRAARLLRSTEMTVAEIAGRVGYASESALSRAFKDRYGEAPSAFRRRGGPAVQDEDAAAPVSDRRGTAAPRGRGDDRSRRARDRAW